MKKVLQILAIGLVTVSCSNDDGIDPQDREKALIGQWEYLSITSDRPVDLNGDGQTATDLFNSQEIKQCLKDNLTIFSDTFSFIDGANFSVLKNQLTCEEDSEESQFVERDVWMLSSDNRNITIQDRGEIWQINELTDNRLEVSYQQLDFNDNTFILTVRYKKS